MDQRMSKDKYYLNIADAVLDRSTCLRRKYGAIIVKNDEILSTGYNGARAGASIAPSSATATASSCAFPAASGTSCAAACTPRPTPSSPPPGAT